MDRWIRLLTAASFGWSIAMTLIFTGVWSTPEPDNGFQVFLSISLNVLLLLVNILLIIKRYRELKREKRRAR